MAVQSGVFNRRTYGSLAEFTAAIGDVIEHTDDLKAAARSRRVNRAFAEKIMLAVTQVNGCRYCDYGHTRAALKEGVSKEEIARIAAGELGQFPEEEAVALFFGQHYAESGGHPDPEAWQRLVNTYGEEPARDIMAYIRMITMGNLLGNTFDAFLSRLTGRPALEGSFFSELAILGLTVVGLVPFGVLMSIRMVRNMRTPVTQTT